MTDDWDFDEAKYSQITEVASKADVDRYVRAGWKLISTHTQLGNPSGDSQSMLVYRLGWPIEAGRPAEMPRDNDLPSMDRGPSVN